MDIEQAIREIENEGLYGNQVHQETLELALAALREKAERERTGGTLADRATYRCSRCGRGTAVKSNYCPNCGCRMDGRDGDE